MIEYSDYLILSDKTRNHFKGDYTSYCNFKKVLELADNISRKQIDTYLYNGEHYKLPIKITELNHILESIQTGKVNSHFDKVKKLSHQLGIRKI